MSRTVGRSCFAKGCPAASCVQPDPPVSTQSIVSTPPLTHYRALLQDPDRCVRALDELAGGLWSQEGGEVVDYFHDAPHHGSNDGSREAAPVTTRSRGRGRGVSPPPRTAAGRRLAAEGGQAVRGAVGNRGTVGSRGHVGRRLGTVVAYLRRCGAPQLEL